MLEQAIVADTGASNLEPSSSDGALYYEYDDIISMKTSKISMEGDLFSSPR